MKIQIDLKSAVCGLTIGIAAMFVIGADSNSGESWTLPNFAFLIWKWRFHNRLLTLKQVRRERMLPEPKVWVLPNFKTFGLRR